MLVRISHFNVLTFSNELRPGDHVIWKSEDQKRPAVVQKVNAAERTAIVLFTDSGKLELVSVLELDPHGTSSDSVAMIPQSTSDGLGVRRGDFVFIHLEGTTNGFEKPRVPRIGELEEWVREGPFVDGHFVGWRKELSELGLNVAARRIPGSDLKTLIKRPSPKDGSLLWIGEVTSVSFAVATLYLLANRFFVGSSRRQCTGDAS